MLNGVSVLLGNPREGLSTKTKWPDFPGLDVVKHFNPNTSKQSEHFYYLDSCQPGRLKCLRKGNTLNRLKGSRIFAD